MYIRVTFKRRITRPLKHSRFPFTFISLVNNVLLSSYCNSLKDGIAQSVWRRVTDWTAAVGLPAGTRISLFSTESRPALGPTQPPIQWIPGVKRPVRDADH
jgi:hypothetical protein